jgi:hypothetical protein
MVDNGPMTTVNGQNAKGQFVPGHKLGKGRPLGARNKDPVRFPKELDPKSELTLRLCELLAGITGDLGGRENMSTSQALLAQRCAWITVQCELLERRASAGETFDVTAYSTMMGHLSRTLNLLGLKRQSRDVTPTLQDYLDAAKPDAAE